MGLHRIVSRHVPLLLHTGRSPTRYYANLARDTNLTNTEDRLRASLGHAYTLSGELGGGGMSQVFAADDVALGRRVVLKVLPPELANVVNIERFRREVQLAATLQQPFIVPVLSAGEADGLLYYSMPRVDGETLQRRLERERQLPIDDTIRILRDVASALAYAHSRGIVHRDIKPANVLLSGQHALVTDFGIAKALGDATKPSQLTATGIVVGTPSYMAPEQAAGDSTIDHRVDLYAIGVLAFEMLTGQPPFSGANPQQVIANQLTREPESVAHYRPNAPHALVDLVERLLEKTPADRPQSAESVMRALEAVVSDSRTALQVGVSARQSKRALFGIAAGVLGLIVLAVGAGVMFSRDSLDITTTAVPHGIRSIAVLPMENASAEQDNAFFADGLTDDLIGALSQLRGLKTISRNSVYALKGKSLSARAIGDTLGADALLTGSVRRRAEGLRIVLQLVNAANDSTIWSHNYDAALSASADIQDSIVHAIVGALELRLTANANQTAESRPISNDAYELFLRGRTLVNARSGLDAAIALFKESLLVDSTFAGTHAGLATAYMITANDQGDRNMASLARSEAEKALQLNDKLSEAHAAKGLLLMIHDRAWDSAGSAFERALELRPAFADAHNWYALYLVFRGRRDAAEREIQTARELDPLSWIIANNSARILALNGKVDPALEELRRAAALGMADYHAFMALIMGQRGDLNAALTENEFALAQTKRSPLALSGYVLALARLGRQTEARAALNELLAAPGARPSWIASAHLALGNKTAALDWLERGVREQRDVWLLDLGVDPYWNALRGEPRFTAALRALGL
jgi:eukaryotic-like serine/threonine-protein kinase